MKQRKIPIYHKKNGKLTRTFLTQDKQRKQESFGLASQLTDEKMNNNKSSHFIIENLLNKR